MVERAPRDRRSFDILSVKKEAKLSASEANDEEVGKGNADLCVSSFPLLQIPRHSSAWNIRN